ncbi:MAG: hypothetical protein EOP53_25510 [Sphingobacteriales bacterium]|nr:MAG: hypothetical protein EOP53_25510 [Sphingobacteriales bacterium]
MIYVFKTSVKTLKDIRQLKPVLNHTFKQAAWNFDLEDCDSVLRLDSSTATPETVIKLLQNKGFDCEELPD